MWALARLCLGQNKEVGHRRKLLLSQTLVLVVESLRLFCFKVVVVFVLDSFELFYFEVEVVNCLKSVEVASLAMVAS